MSETHKTHTNEQWNKSLLEKPRVSLSKRKKSEKNLSLPGRMISAVRYRAAIPLSRFSSPLLWAFCCPAWVLLLPFMGYFPAILVVGLSTMWIVSFLFSIFLFVFVLVFQVVCLRIYMGSFLYTARSSAAEDVW